MTQTQPTQLASLKQTGRMQARDAGVGNVKKFFESQKGTLIAVLPKHVDADRMLKIALGAMRTTPKLMNCTVESLFGAIVQCSQLGLEPNTPLGHAYLIPFDNKKKGITEVQIVFGYKGLVDLSRRSGQIVSIAAHEVCTNDRFEYEYGLEEKLVHKPALSKRGEVIAFYSVAKLVGGGYAFEVMSREQVEEIRDASQNYKFARDKGSTVWGQHFVEMGRKTVLRRLFKYLPVSIELATASALDGKVDHDTQALDSVLSGEFTVIDDDAPQVEEEPEPPALTHEPGETINTLTGEITQPEPEPVTRQASTKPSRTTAQPQPQPTEQAGFDDLSME
ncbi:recombination protein RecT [Azomonas macrocytogenes]|uniref:Recombination protein RecT n=1 Tax=Azomonas macrocytogenes TaxID=69962 RepID=A0A839T4R7_AZOMA|nr:recombination protein RecT [Azomonas macrocytogenes]MBB3103750.1 recombination protein RecT [Azomonas macrocytogenes]